MTPPSSANSKGTQAKRFRIAFSFAGDKRDFVKDVADLLAQRFGEDRILYDKFHNAEFSRSDLAFYLPDLYEKEADLVVAVFCADYDKKEWCGLEWNAIYGLLKQRKVGEVMLTRFNRVEGKGLRGLAGYTDLDAFTPEQAAAEILQRLALNEGKPRNSYIKALPRDSKNTDTFILNNLPRIPFFFGRETDLAKIADALKLEKEQIWGALIRGAGGLGKTSLAIRAAQSCTVNQFERILFLTAKERKLTPAGPKALSGFVLPGYLQMLNEILGLLERKDLLKCPAPKRAKAVIEALRNQRALLILDNLETLADQDQFELVDFVEQLPKGCKAILTARRSSAEGGRIIELSKLDKEAALKFLSELASDRPLLEKARISTRIRLYEETGGNPLLMRWVVGQLGRGKCVTIAKALSFLKKAPPENDPLAFIFGDLVDVLSPSEIKAINGLSGLRGPVNSKVLAKRAKISPRTAETVLSDLTDRGLVNSDSARETFCVLPVVVGYLKELLPKRKK